MDKIKSRATYYAMALVLLLITIFTVTMIQDKKKVLEGKTLAHRQLLKSSFDLALLDTQKGLNAISYKISGDRAIVDAFAAGDRDALYRLTLPYFEEATIRQEIDLAGYILADGTHFLRMKDPKKFGDNITGKRPILAHAIATRQSVTSIDVTLYNVGLVSIVPIFKNSKFIGILQVTADIKRIQDRLNTHSAIKSAIAFDTQKLKALLPGADAKTYNGYSMISSNDPLFDHLPSSFTFAKSSRYTILDHDYIIASRPLLNFQNEKTAMMTCAFDITDDTDAYADQIRNLLLISLTLMSVIAIVLHYGFSILLRRIEQDTHVARRLNEKLEHQLYTDHLTGLPNRNALIRDMGEQRFYALILLNIDNFKQINDFYGHAVGDGILLELSHALSEIIETLPLKLYKMPSDEYAIALTRSMSASELESARQAILHHLEAKHYDLMGASIYITLTMGMDVATVSPGREPMHLLSNADMALKSAKKRHLSFLQYNDTLQIKQEFESNILWSKKVKEAIEEKRFALHYQPIIDVGTGTVIEYEALIRMREEDGSVVSPVKFLPAARQSHLYFHISQFVISEVFAMMERTTHRFSINLSVEDIFHTPTREFLLHHLRTSEHASRLIIEILESEGIENFNEVSAFIAEAKHYGCQIAIDDFGTGYSNFAHILRLNVDLLKIDGSLIRNIDTDVGAQTIVTAVTNFSKRLGLKTVAEFVHSEAVLAKCRELGVDYMQGYLLGEPSPL